MASITQGPDVVVDPNLTQATVSWSADVDSYGQVDYGLNQANLDQSIQDLNFGQDHTVLLTGLQSGQTYNFGVSILDSNGNNIFSTPNLTFSTVSAPSPAVTTGPIADPDSDSAEISWSCNVSGTGMVQMGQDQTNLNMVFNDPNVSTDHSVTPQGLAPVSQYYYNVANVDPNTGVVLVQSSTSSFTTQPVVAGATLRFPIATPWLVRRGHTSTFNVFVLKGGKPAPNEKVTFQILSNNGNFSGSNTATDTTNANGRAKVIFTAGHQRGIVRVQITAQNAKNKLFLHCLII